MTRNYLILSFFILIGIIACNSKENLSYGADIEPLLLTCANQYCHGQYHPDGNILTYESAIEFASQAKFLASIKHEDGFSPMPQGAEKLSEESISLIEEWIDQGMVE